MSVTSQYRGRLQLARQDKIAQFIAGTLAAISMISFLALGTYLWALGWLQGTKLIDPFSTAASAPTVVVTPPTAPATAPSPEPTALTFESACAAAKRAYEQTDYPEAWQITAAALPLAKTPDQQRRLNNLRRQIGPHVDPDDLLRDTRLPAVQDWSLPNPPRIDVHLIKVP